MAVVCGRHCAALTPSCAGALPQRVEADFAEQAAKEGLVGLAGHRWRARCSLPSSSFSLVLLLLSVSC